MMEKDPEKTPGGFSFEPPTGDIKPPLTEEGLREDEEEIKSTEARQFVQGKIPLHPAVIKAPASVVGRLATEITGYPGFTFTEEELNDLAELWVACGIETSPTIQALIGSVAVLGVKIGGYTVWRRAGKPGDVRQKAIEEVANR